MQIIRGKALHKRDLKSAQGFSLIELLIVIVLIAILAAIAVPNFSKYRYNANLKEAAQVISADMKFYKQKAMAENRRYLLYYPNWWNNNICRIYRLNGNATDWSGLTWLQDKKISDDGFVEIIETPSFLNTIAGSSYSSSWIILYPRGTTGNGTLKLRHSKNLSTATIETNIMGRVNVKYDLK